MRNHDIMTLFLLSLAACIAPIESFASSHAFVSIVTCPTTSRKQHHSRLYYKDERPDTGVEKNRSAPRRLTIPVLGPFPGQGPLLLGAEMSLTPPTPMQWQSLEEAFYIHKLHLQQELENNSGNEASVTASGVSAAPLIAILDNAKDMSVHGTQGRYATIAAVVGVSSSPSTGSKNIDMTDRSSFMESING